MILYSSIKIFRQLFILVNNILIFNLRLEKKNFLYYTLIYHLIKEKSYMLSNKITIIGCGGVGSTIAYALTYMNNINEIALVDINKNLSIGESMDIAHGISCISLVSLYPGTYEDCKDSDIIIITAGRNRMANETRDALLEDNKKIMQSILDEMKPYYSNSFVIIVSNPVDKLTEYAEDQMFIPRHKICSSGCMLDTSRCICVIAQYLNVETNAVNAFSVGKHGVGQRILWDKVTINNDPIDTYCAKNSIPWNENIKKSLNSKVSEMGTEIISCKGRTQYGIATVVAHLTNCLYSTEYTLVSVGTRINNIPHVESELVYIGNMEIKSTN